MRNLRTRIYRAMYKAGWTTSEYDDTLRSRIAHALYDWKHWYDWGHPVMWLVGRYDSGNAGAPRGRDLWWIPVDHVEGAYAPLLAELEQRHGCYVTTDYRVVRECPIGWRIFDLQDDGMTVVIGRWPTEPEDGGHIQKIIGGMNRRQMRLLLRWYLWDHKAKAQWFGLRRWVYYKALHAAVAQRKPFSCAAVPARGSGGYSHWSCHLRKRHSGPHRFNNYTWSRSGERVQHDPVDAS